MSKNRLSKILSASGIASRRACEEIIFKGRVTVNGKVEKIPQTIVDTDVDIIKVDHHLIKVEDKVYYLLNKPYGYICTAKPSGRAKIVLDLFHDEGHRLFTVGRLDRDTEGLLLVTNDGHFANKVIHPSANIQKEYIAKTDQEIMPEHLKVISNGTLVEGVFVKPLKVSKVRRGTVKVVVMEGKKREVRLLLEAAGLKIQGLMRTRLGGLRLGDLPPGAWRELTAKERELIFS